MLSLFTVGDGGWLAANGGSTLSPQGLGCRVNSLAGRTETISAATEQSRRVHVPSLNILKYSFFSCVHGVSLRAVAHSRSKYISVKCSQSELFYRSAYHTGERLPTPAQHPATHLNNMYTHCPGRILVRRPFRPPACTAPVELKR